jgi:hypothetical protein
MRIIEMRGNEDDGKRLWWNMGDRGGGGDEVWG